MAMTPEDKSQLEAVLGEMGVKPKMDTVEDFEIWMKGYLASKGKIDPAVQISTHFPQVSKFSGEVKGDHVPFDIWKFEVISLQKEKIHKPEVIQQAIRRSLKGEACRIAMRLGPEASVESLIHKMESVYGSIDYSHDILGSFYSARQEEDEDAVSWGFRLENILDHALEQGQIKPDAAKMMLRSRFWAGLHQDLKDVTRHYYEAEGDLDELRIQVRRIEQEHLRLKDPGQKSKDKKVLPSKMVQPTVDSPVMKGMAEMKKAFEELTSKMQAMQKQLNDLQETQLKNPPAHDIGSQRGPGQNTWAPSSRLPPGVFAPRSGAGRGRNSGCYRCGHPSHYARDCTFNLNR